MTLSLPSGKSINLATVTWAERKTWTETPHAGERYTHDGVVVHFVGGTQIRLTGTDAMKVAQEFGL